MTSQADQPISNQKHHISNICYIGAGNVGGSSAAITAFKNPHIVVNAVDRDFRLIMEWNSERIPVYEPGLKEIIEITRGPPKDSIYVDYITKQGAAAPGYSLKPKVEKCNTNTPNLFFTTDIQGAITEADLVFICVDTPAKFNSDSKESSLDTSAVEDVALQIAKASKDFTIVVEKSTVPCKTAALVQDILSANSDKGSSFAVLSNPEFLTQGTAVQNLLHPDRVLIGAPDTDEGKEAAALVAGVYTSWIAPELIMFTSVWSSELVKLASNALLAQRISSTNAISAICEEIGADIVDVMSACGRDKRIGPNMLKTSIGFGGSCFRKDICSLVYLAECLRLDEVAGYWKAVISLNDYHKKRTSNKIDSRLPGGFGGKVVAILGFSYKKNTADARESPAISLVHDMVTRKAHVRVFDPQVCPDKVHTALLAALLSREALSEYVTVMKTPYQACLNADAVIVATEWDMFCNRPSQTNATSFQKDDALTYSQGDIGRVNGDAVDWDRICKSMNRPAFVFDGCNILDSAQLKAFGVVVESIGRPKS